MKLKFYNDPGHGWLAVKRSLLEKYVDPKTISSYSYQRKDNVYLEEDCDAMKLIVAMRQAGVALEIVDSDTRRRSKIRSYDHFRSA